MMSQTNTIVVADAHLEGAQAETAAFLAMLAAFQAAPLHRLVLLGDIFTFWIGTKKMQFPHHLPVLTALARLREQGVLLIYTEGNRDYFLSDLYLNAPFHEIVSKGTQADIGGRRWHFAHGDLINPHDWQYWRWRSFSRNRLFFALFSALPRFAAARLADAIERRFRMTNARHKSAFPAATCQEYAERLWRQGVDAIALGHFHDAYHFDAARDGRRTDLYVVPAWKDAHEYLRIDADGRAAVCKSNFKSLKDV